MVNYKIVTMYGNMEDPDAFYYFYRTKMVPKILKLDGVKKIAVNILSDSPLSSNAENANKPKHSVMGELYVEDVERFMNSFQNSEVGKAIAKFLTKEAREYATLYLAIEETIEK